MRTSEPASGPLAYSAATFAYETPAHRQARQAGEARAPGMQLSAVEGQLLQLLARLVEAKRVLEIGTFMGYSTLWLAGGTAPGGHVTTLEANPEHAALARRHLAAATLDVRVEVMEGAALEVLPAVVAGSCFDLVFIDAAKAEYAAYLDQLEPHVRAGGLIVGDNTLLFGHMVDQPWKDVSTKARHAMHRFNQRLGNPAHYDGVLIPTVEGLTVARKKHGPAEDGGGPGSGAPRGG